ncbi:unnamed protein product, partial [Candidula unifasciata]
MFLIKNQSGIHGARISREELRQPHGRTLCPRGLCCPGETGHHYTLQEQTLPPAHLLNNLLPVLIRQQLDFRIFVIDQAMPTLFNRCLLFNIGYLEALKIDNYDCFIFHDVDMVVLNDNCLYRCSQHPRHLTAAISKWKYRLPYSSFFGGVVAFTRQQFRDINGCSNVYFGWGGEDDDLRSRVVKAGYKVIRYPKDIGRYDTIEHKPDDGNSPNKGRTKLLQSLRDRLDSQGLNTTVYQVTAVLFKPLYTWIHVQVNMTQILQ